MFYGFLADVVGALHFGYVAFVVFGLVLTLLGIVLGWRWIRNFKFRVLHLIMILIVALESLGEVMCPLTTWEKTLRVWAGQPAGGDSFVADILNRIMFFNCVPYNHWIFKSAYVSFAALVVMTFVIAPPRRRALEPANVDRGVLAQALLGTLAFIFLYTAWCIEDYKRSWDAWRMEEYEETVTRLPLHVHRPAAPLKEDRLAVYFLAFTGVNFVGLLIVCWAMRPGRERSADGVKHTGQIANPP